MNAKVMLTKNNTREKSIAFIAKHEKPFRPTITAGGLFRVNRKLLTNRPKLELFVVPMPFNLD